MPTIVRVGSHTAREKPHTRIGHKTQGYFSWNREGAWYECPSEMSQDALKLMAPRFITWVNGPQNTVGWYRRKSDAQKRADELNRTFG